jgi:glycosyltransferase involved in cell wall biosynthesis
VKRCLDALENQSRRPDQIVVVYRPEDRETAAMLEAWTITDPGRRVAVEIERPGLVYALEAGTAASTSEVVAFMDDDAIPHPDWVPELIRGFMDPSVGAVGGKLLDHVAGERVAGRIDVPGRVRWYGRIIWGHNLETGHYGGVDWLTGSNMAMRRALVRHDTRLQHQSGGLAMANDLDACLHVRRSGHRVLYSPWAVVEHHTTSFRDPILGSRVPDHDVVTGSANHTYALLKHIRGPRRPFLHLWGYLMGSRSMAGPIRVALEVPRSPRRAAAMLRRIPRVWKGRRLGARMYREWRAAPEDRPLQRAPGAPAAAGTRKPSA